MLTLIQLTDLHLIADPDADYKGFNSQRGLDAVMTHAQQQPIWPPDGILLTGDLVQDDSHSAYQRLAEQAESWNVPVYCLPGNHDVPQYFQTLLPSAQVSIDGTHRLKHDIQLIMLNSTQMNAVSGQLPKHELQRLQRHLYQHPQTPTIIALHHPPVATGSRWMDAIGLHNAAEFWQCIAEYQQGQIAAVVCGHIHQALDTTFTLTDNQKTAIRVLGCPSTGRQFLPQADEFTVDTQPPGYRLLQLSADGQLTTSVHRVPGTAL